MTPNEALIHLTELAAQHDIQVEIDCPYCEKALAVLRVVVEERDAWKTRAMTGLDELLALRAEVKCLSKPKEPK